MQQIFAQRLKSARLIEGLTMEALANAIGVSKQMISKYEAAKSMPDSSVLLALAKALHQKPDFFFRPHRIEIGKVEFRKKSRMPQAQSKAIAERVRAMLENYLAVEEMLGISYSFINPIATNVIDSSSALEDALHQLREKWELGLDPIVNIVELLEGREIKVLEIDSGSEDFDGLATLANDRFPVVVVNKNFSIERKRFTLLHELGHLLLQFPVEMDPKEKEKWCHRFAASFLLPEKAIKEITTKRGDFATREIELLQQRYGISFQAIVFRMSELNLISKEVQRRFFIRMRQDADFGAQVDKERFVGEETSHRFEALVYRALTQGLISMSRASGLLGVSVSEVHKTHQLL
jgi:Zn-dependent peptidase ImmA (M78 family)/transcriptional regulator with XRE-family HTH domain